MVNEILEKECAWSFLKNTQLPIILYGMGNGADKVLNIFEEKGIKCSGIMASNSFAKHKLFRGFVVKKISEIEQEFSDFIIVLSFGTQREDVIDNIISLSKKYQLLVANVPVFGETIVDESFVKKHKTQIEKAYNLFDDELSAKVYKNILSFYYTGKISELLNVTTSKEEVFKEVLKLTSKEDFLDLGAYKGDTIEEFLCYTNGKYSTIKALEPDKKNFKKLVDYVQGLENTTVYNIGVWAESRQMSFSNTAGRNASLLNKSNKESLTNVTSVDELLIGTKVSYIKMDVEGAEVQTINGAKNTILKYSPKLNIAVYHRFEDIFEIPLQLAKINFKYKFYLRHHPYIPAWDTNLYCIIVN